MEWEDLEGILFMAYDGIEEKIGKVCIVNDKDEYHLINIEDGSTIFKKFCRYYTTKDGYIIMHNKYLVSSFIYGPLQDRVWEVSYKPTLVSYKEYTLSYNSSDEIVVIEIFSNITGKLIDRVVYNFGINLVANIKLDDFRYIQIKRKKIASKTIQSITRGASNYDMNYKIKLDILGGVYDKLKKILKIA